MDRGEWFLELYAPFHSTADLELFEHFTRTHDLKQVAHNLRHSSFRDSSKPVAILAHGTVHASRLNVPNVRFIPEARYSVISAPQLARDHGLEIIFMDQRFHVISRETREHVGKGYLVKREYGTGAGNVRSRGMYVLNHLQIYQSADWPFRSMRRMLTLGMGCWGGGVPFRRHRSNNDDDTTNNGHLLSYNPGAIYPPIQLLRHSPYQQIDYTSSPNICIQELPEDDSDWVLDSFAMAHITSNLLVMYHLRRDYILDRSLPPPRMIWSGLVRAKRLEIPNVTYIWRYDVAADAMTDVVSVPQLASNYGMVTVFEPTGCYLWDPATRQDVGRARLRNGSYVLDYLLIGKDAAERLPHYQGKGASHQQLVVGGKHPQLEASSRHDLVQCEQGPSSASCNRRPQLTMHGEKYKYTLTEWPEGDRFGLVRFNRPNGVELPIRVGQGYAYSQPAAAPFQGDVYIMDSGASFHMTPDRNLLQSYMDHADGMFPNHFPTTIYVGDGVSLRVRGIGNIDTGVIRLQDVLHIEGLVANLVSVSQLTHQLTNHLVDKLGKAARQLHPVGVVFRLNNFAVKVGEAEVGNGARVEQVYHLHKLHEFPADD